MFMGVAYCSNSGNAKFNRSGYLHEKTNSNGENPNNAGDVHTSISKAATDVNNDHISPFPVRFLQIFL